MDDYYTNPTFVFGLVFVLFFTLWLMTLMTFKSILFFALVCFYFILSPEMWRLPYLQNMRYYADQLQAYSYVRSQNSVLVYKFNLAKHNKLIKEISCWQNMYFQHLFTIYISINELLRSIINVSVPKYLGKQIFIKLADHDLWVETGPFKMHICDAAC